MQSSKAADERMVEPSPHELFIETMTSPLGSIDLVAQSDTLISLDFSECRERMHQLLTKRFGAVSLIPHPHQFSDRLRDYFAGNLSAIQGITTLLRGTPFQNRVWTALSAIEPGNTLTYGELAQRIHQPRAAQAVGRANALNPILIVLPCHRIIGQNKKMVGYSGGINRKEWLLNHERAYRSQMR